MSTLLLFFIVGCLLLPFYVAYCILKFILYLFGVDLRKNEPPSNIRNL